MHRAGLLLLAVVLGACRTSPRQAPASTLLTPIFGPVIGAEVIGGRADGAAGNNDDEIVLLAGGVDLVRISLATRRSARVKLRLAAGSGGFREDCWNLAALGEPYFGLFAAGDRLLFQRADFLPPGPALMAGGADRRPAAAWSTIATRTFPALARASVAALNMVTCGPTKASERACWFPDEAAVFLVTDSGSTRRLVLRGLDLVSPETLLTSDNPRRPVRDAYVDGDGTIWILSSGAPPPGTAEQPGGWVLASYASDGASKGIVRLPEAARLILRADARHVTLVMASGMIGQVPRW